MTAHRSPELGKLVDVVPVVEAREHGPLTMVLVSIERWDRCFVMNFDLQQNEPAERGAERLFPALDLHVSDGNGGEYACWFAGGYGGGRRDRGTQHRLIYTLTPPLATALEELRVTAQLQLMRQEEGFPPRQVVVRTEPGPWTFTATLPLSRNH